MTIQDDPVIARIREARRQISEMCDHDPDKLVAYYMEIQKQYQSRLVKASELPEEAESEAGEAELVEA